MPTTKAPAAGRRAPTRAVEAPAASAGAAGRDPQAAAAAAGVHALVHCYLREVEGWWLEGGDAAAVVVVPVLRGAGQLHLGVRHQSATYRHRFVLPARLVVGDTPARPVDLATLAALLVDELAAGDPAADDPAAGDPAAGDPDAGDPAAGDPNAGDRGGERARTLLARVLDSVDAVATHLTARADEVDELWSADPLPFGRSEQALLLGHPVHPTPKSRGEMAPRERRRYSPELAARFVPSWWAVDPDLVVHDSATGTPAPALVAALLRDGGPTEAALERALAGLGPRVLVPAHPFEVDHLHDDPVVAGLRASGALVDLGPLGPPVWPTTSVRTLYRPEWPWQLKCSLHVRVTNSQRVTLDKELGRAVEAARLAATEVGRRATEVAPRFTMVHDPAFLAVRHDGAILPGFSVLLRANRWGPDGPDDVTALTTLCQDHPYGGRSRLGALVADLATRTGRSEADVARAWFARFCDVAVVSLVRLYLDVGLCFEAHQQNLLVELEGGWPVRAVYRDSQGYFHRAAAHDDLVAVVPGLGEATESIFPEALADERLVYYLFVNLALGVVDTLGAAGAIDERVLLGDLRAVLEAERARGGRYPATLLDHLLDDGHWPCKANLRTRLGGLDELVGDIATQSVYGRIPNPLRAGGS